MSSTCFSAIAWSDGMLLMPQHFQWADHLMHQRISALMEHPGILRIHAVSQALTQSTFALERLHARMPNGMPVILDAGHDALPQPLQLQQQSGVVCVYADTQTQQHTVKLHDQHGDPQTYVDVPVGTPVLRLAWYQDHPHALPLARVIHDGIGHRLDPDYIPPLLCLHGHPPVVQRMKNILAHLQDETRVQGCVGVLLGMLAMARIDPMHVFVEWLRLVGTLSNTHHHTGIMWDPCRPGDGFHALLTWTENYLQHTHHTQATPESFHPVDGNMLRASLPQHLGSGAVLALHYQPHPADPCIPTPSHLKLAPPDRMDFLRHHGQPGITLTPCVDGAPFTFQITMQHPLMNDARHQHALILYAPLHMQGTWHLHSHQEKNHG